MRFRDFIVIMMFALNCAFTGVILWIFIRFQVEPSTIIGAWFAWTGVEAGALAAITIKKVPHEAKITENIDITEENTNDGE